MPLLLIKTIGFVTGRAQYGGGFVPGKVVRSHNCLYIPYGGQEISISNYDILVSDKPNVLSWRKPESGGKFTISYICTLGHDLLKALLP